MKENEKTLRRFWEANHCNGAHNVVGLAYSVHELGKAMLEAGFGTVAIAKDPAIRKITSALSIASGFHIAGHELYELHHALSVKRCEIMAVQEYAAIMEENNW